MLLLCGFCETRLPPKLGRGPFGTAPVLVEGRAPRNTAPQRPDFVLSGASDARAKSKVPGLCYVLQTQLWRQNGGGPQDGTQCCARAALTPPPLPVCDWVLQTGDGLCGTSDAMQAAPGAQPKWAELPDLVLARIIASLPDSHRPQLRQARRGSQYVHPAQQ